MEAGRTTARAMRRSRLDAARADESHDAVAHKRDPEIHRRYYVKKKARFARLEAKLVAKMHEFDRLLRENVDLRLREQVLKSMVATRDEQIAVLGRLGSLTLAHTPGSSGPAGSGGSVPEGRPRGAADSAGMGPVPGNGSGGVCAGPSLVQAGGASPSSSAATAPSSSSSTSTDSDPDAGAGAGRQRGRGAARSRRPADALPAAASGLPLARRLRCQRAPPASPPQQTQQPPPPPQQQQQQRQRRRQQQAEAPADASAAHVGAGCEAEVRSLYIDYVAQVRPLVAALDAADQADDPALAERITALTLELDASLAGWMWANPGGLLQLQGTHLTQPGIVANPLLWRAVVRELNMVIPDDALSLLYKAHEAKLGDMQARVAKAASRLTAFTQQGHEAGGAVHARPEHVADMLMLADEVRRTLESEGELWLRLYKSHSRLDPQDPLNRARCAVLCYPYWPDGSALLHERLRQLAELRAARQGTAGPSGDDSDAAGPPERSGWQSAAPRAAQHTVAAAGAAGSVNASATRGSSRRGARA